jgi:hypothetical protein
VAKETASPLSTSHLPNYRKLKNVVIPSEARNLLFASAPIKQTVEAKIAPPILIR